MANMKTITTKAKEYGMTAERLQKAQEKSKSNAKKLKMAELDRMRKANMLNDSYNANLKKWKPKSW